ncbi:hypothetical protein MASR1M6_14070 [Rubrivivax sp.]
MTAAALPPVLSSALPGAMSSAPSGASSATGPSAAGANAGSSASKEPGAFARELSSARKDAKADRSEPRPADRSPEAPKTGRKESPDSRPRSQASGKPQDPQDARDSTDPTQRALRRWLAAAQGSATDATDATDGPPDTDSLTGAAPDAARPQDGADAGTAEDATALAAALQSPPRSGVHGGKDPSDSEDLAETEGLLAAQGAAAPNARPPGGSAAITRPIADAGAGAGELGTASRNGVASGLELRAVDAAPSEARSDSNPIAAPSPRAPRSDFAGELASKGRPRADPTAEAGPSIDIQSITPAGDHDTKPTPTPAAPAPLAAFAAELARSSQALAEPAAQAQPGADIRLPTSVHSPQFVPHLAGELVMLAREGVQEARVHLHPAELGPIAVQITLDGQAAQVRLAVDSALTRDLLEQGLPTLAAAMRENGLTLAGGGVFQQPRDPSRQGQEGSPGRPGQDAGGQAAASSGADAGVDGAAGSARPLRLRAAGRIDVFA